MKHRTLIFMFFVCFAAVNGFCFPASDRSNPPAVSSQQNIDNKANEDITKVKEELTELKRMQGETNDQLKEINDKIGGTGSSSTQFSGSKSQDSKFFVPITLKTVKEFEKIPDFNKLEFYVDKNLNLIPKDQVTSYGVVKDGKLVDSEKNLSESELVIRSEKPLQIANFDEESFDSIEILLQMQEKSVLLKFARNQQNCFEFDYATVEGNKYIDEQGERPLLHFFDERDMDNRITAVVQTETFIPQARVVTASRSSSSSSSGNQPQISENVMFNGRGNYLKQEAVVEYMCEYAWGDFLKRKDITALVQKYIKISAEENINHDIAIAQMLHITEHLSNTKLLSDRNYAGFEKEGTRWNGKFSDSDTGVMAHIQHLKGYATTGRLNRDIVDPRFHLLESTNRRGKGSSLRELCKLWSPGNWSNYEESLRTILKDLYTYQDKYYRL